jgi:formyltetrahydrofolate dehydrogenase
MIPAWKWGKAEKHEKLELTPEEEQLQEKIRIIWSAILSGQAVEEHTDFFKSGAGSMDVIRLLEEVQEVTGVEMDYDDVYMNLTFVDFVKQLVLTSRGGQDTELEYDAVSLYIMLLYSQCMKFYLSSTTNSKSKGQPSSHCLLRQT